MKRFKGLAVPYFVWLVLLVVVPAITMIVLTFLQSNGTNWEGAYWSLDSYRRLADPSILKALWNSLVIAFWTVLFCFLLGYPVAYFLSFSTHIKNKSLFLLLLILPMWCNSMLRIVSWLRFFSMDAFATWHLVGTNGAVIFVTVTTYLPFMVFPIFTVLEKMDRSLIEASSDLGVPSWKTFLKVTFPLSLEGVSSGVIMVFLPAATGFAISGTIGQGKVRLMGNLIQAVFEKNNYNFGSLLSLLTSLVILLLVGAVMGGRELHKRRKVRHVNA